MPLLPDGWVDMDTIKRYDFATEEEAFCTCTSVISIDGEYVRYADFNKLEMQLLRTQAKLLRACAEIRKLKDTGGCDHEFEILPNAVVQCVKCDYVFE